MIYYHNRKEEAAMSLSEARKRANKKWNDENQKSKYDRIQLVVPKGEAEKIKAFAKQQGKSVNNLMYTLVSEAMERGAI